MSKCVCSGAGTACSFGSATGTLMVLPSNRCLSAAPIANIMDHKPLVNIPPFGMCSSPTNPAVIAASGSVPCVPVTLLPWTPGVATVLLNQLPVLHDGSILMCQWGGVIEVKQAGQSGVTVP